MRVLKDLISYILNGGYIKCKIWSTYSVISVEEKLFLIGIDVYHNVS